MYKNTAKVNRRFLSLSRKPSKFLKDKNILNFELVYEASSVEPLISFT